MGTTTIDFTITSEVIITVISIIVTIIIAVIGGIYAIITNTKKYELTENYRQELLSWYINTIDIMIKMIHLIENQSFHSTSIKFELLSKLSTQIEIGRFYFPNVIKGDLYGIKKPSAYQGYRHINLEFLIHFYNIVYHTKDSTCISLLWKLERNFTSMIFDIINPRKRIKSYSKYIAITIPKGDSIEDFLDKNPMNYRVFK